MNDRTIRVTFFPALSSSSELLQCQCEGGSDAALDTNQALMARANEVSKQFGDAVDLEIARYWSSAGDDSLINKLNAVLRESGKRFVVTRLNFYTFLESVAPVVAVDNKILSSRRVPAWGEIVQAITLASNSTLGRELHIAHQSDCCPPSGSCC